MRTMSNQVKYNTGTFPFRPILSHGTARRNRGGAELSCVIDSGVDSKGRFNPPTSIIHVDSYFALSPLKMGFTS